MPDETTYREFIDWFKMTWHLPETEALLPLIRARYTPEEAALLTGMSPRLAPLDELAETKQTAPADLEAKLDALARKGVVYRQAKDGAPWYRLSDAFFTFLRSSFWAGGKDDTTRTVATLTNKYFRNGFFDDWGDVHYKGLRALPIEETIEDTRQILPHEDVVQVLDSLDYFAVSICPCRHRKNIDPNSPNCKHPDEVCLHFGDLGRYTVENGLGREITREDAREILRTAAKSGLVHGVSNWLEGVDTICNCCKCCCMWLEGFHVLKHPTSLSPSNYRVKGDPEKCKACGLCVRRCPMDAQSLVESPLANNKFGKVSSVTEEHCIGCGVCAYTCPVEALMLERCAETDIEHPPQNVLEFAMHYVSDRQAAQERREKAPAQPLKSSPK